MELVKIKKYMDDFKTQVKINNDQVHNREKGKEQTFKTHLNNLFENDHSSKETKHMMRNSSMPHLRDFKAHVEKVLDLQYYILL